MADYTWGTAPVISFSITDNIYRSSSASTYYSGNVTVTLSGLSGGSYFGYSIYCTVNGTQRTLKGNTPSQWSSGAYSESFSISGNTTSNSITITVVLSSNSGRDSKTVYYTTSIGSYVPNTAPTISASSVDMGGTVTISFPNSGSGLTFALSYEFGSLTGQTDGLSASSGIASSATFTPPISLANQIPSAASGKCIITSKTYSWGSLVATNTVSLTLNVPASVVPTITSVAISEGTEGISAKFNGYVQNRSTLSVAITAAGVRGSTIEKYETYIQSTLYRGNSFTSNVITASGTIGVVTIVTDSRGRTATVSNSVTILAYSRPTINSFSAWRITTDGATNDEGTRIALAMNFAISSVGGLNDHTYNLKYRTSTDEEFTSFGSGLASWSYEGTQLFTNAPVLSIDSAYVFRLEITDYFETVGFDVQVSTSFTIMDFRSSGKGMAIGKVSEKDALEVAMNAEFSGQVKIYAPSTGQADAGLLRMYRADGSLLGFLATSDSGNGLNLHFYTDGAWAGVVKFMPDGTIIAKNLNSYGTATTG